MESYRHYIRTDAAGIVIHGFSDAFEQPQDGDVQLQGDFGRHFQFHLINDRGQFIFKFENGAIQVRSQSELDAEWSSRPTPPPSDSERIKLLEDALLDLMLGGL